MAKYQQGYQRKNSDSKNLIILISSIVGLVLLAVAAILVYNLVPGLKKAPKNFSNEKYAQYFISDYDKVLTPHKERKDFIIYVCSKSSTTDKNMLKVLSYIDEFEKDGTLVKLYLLDYDKFDSTQDETEKKNKEKVDAHLGFACQAGTLIAVSDNQLLNKSKQVVTDASKISEALKTLTNKQAWLDYNKE